ncbi:MAG: IclR family transcriptional regulator [Rhodospirillales bacterium]|jgi:DNA-binding IclR family transcriptional regulator|nr:IclR family transcriptional regulator [Rhodospirillales bacterium]
MTSSNPVRRMTLIIDVVASSHDSMTLADISKAVELPPSTTHRTLNILLDVGYLKLDPATKSYEIGERLKRVLLLSLGTGSLEELARPVLVELAEKFAETAYVVQMTSSGLQLVDYYLPTTGSRTLVHPGFEFPMHATASGKAIFAFKSDEEIELELTKSIEKFMPNTIIGKKAIKAELRHTRERGYATNDSELDPGIYAVAAPLKLGEDTIIGALAIVGVRERFCGNFKTEDIASSIVKAADDISRLLFSGVK